MKQLIMCVLGLCLTISYAFSVQSTHDTVRGQSWLMADNQNAPVAEVTGHTKTISNGRYIGGGVATILLGFGIGHAIQGRWKESGWIFTLGDTIILSGLWTSGFLIVRSSISGNKDQVAGYGIGMGIFVILLLGSKIWSSIDAWSLPSHYKIVQASRFQVSPLVVSNYSDSSKIGLGLGMKYRF